MVRFVSFLGPSSDGLRIYTPGVSPARRCGGEGAGGTGRIILHWARCTYQINRDRRNSPIRRRALWNTIATLTIREKTKPLPDREVADLPTLFGRSPSIAAIRRTGAPEEDDFETSVISPSDGRRAAQERTHPSESPSISVASSPSPEGLRNTRGPLIPRARASPSSAVAGNIRPALFVASPHIPDARSTVIPTCADLITFVSSSPKGRRADQ